MKSIKSFENYTNKQTWGNGFSIWVRINEDGTETYAAVDDKCITRDLVREAFKMIDSGDWAQADTGGYMNVYSKNSLVA